MEITAKELRGKPGQIIEQAARGAEVIITIRGEKKARLIAYKKSTKNSDREIEREDEIFGLWKERDDIGSVNKYVRTIRKRIYIEEYHLSNSMELADALIAATCINNSELLLTANEKHYKHIPNIQLKKFAP